MTTQGEMMGRKEEYILRGSAPNASPRTYDTLDEAEDALKEAVRMWPDYNHRLVMLITRIEEITLHRHLPVRE